MRLQPFFSYFGAKARIARRYPAPLFDTVVEPFAGSASYALERPERRVVLVDLDPVIVGLWRYLIRVKMAEVLALPLLEDGASVADLPVSQEARSLIGFWCNKGAARPCQQITTSWGRLYPEQFWHERTRARVARQVERIRHWVALEGQYHEATSAVRGAATWFVDPPYVGRSRTSKYRAGREETRPVGDRYRCNTRGIDFAELGEWCQGLEGQVIACEHVGATWLPFREFVDARANGQRTCREAIWCNGDWPARQLALEASS